MSKLDVNAMMETMREQLLRDEADGNLAGLTVEDLADAMSHPAAPETISQAMAWEAESVKAGEPAPDFALPRLHAPDVTVTLSDHFGERPVALVFGSYT